MPSLNHDASQHFVVETRRVTFTADPNNPAVPEKDAQGRYIKPRGEVGTAAGWSLDDTMLACGIKDWKNVRNNLNNTIGQYLDHSLALTKQPKERKEGTINVVSPPALQVTLCSCEPQLRKQFPQLVDNFVDAWPIYQAMKVRLKQTVSKGIKQSDGWPRRFSDDVQPLRRGRSLKR